jgi:hypothetical protein
MENRTVELQAVAVFVLVFVVFVGFVEFVEFVECIGLRTF